MLSLEIPEEFRIKTAAIYYTADYVLITANNSNN
jgi:hypothetical protein